MFWRYYSWWRNPIDQREIRRCEGQVHTWKARYSNGGRYHVRRSCKAAASFSGSESAHYACLIEVTK